MSEHINDEPEWTDFKIENLEVTSEHHDQGTQPSEEDNEFPNNDDDGYASPTTGSPSRSQTPHTPSTSSSQVNLQFTPNASTQSIYQSDSGSNSTTNSHSHFDHTPLRGFRTLNDLYENTEKLLLAEDEAKNYKEAGMVDCNETLIPMDPGTKLIKITEGTMVNPTEYRSLIGCLRYLLHTRPDLSYSERRIMESPTSITEETRYMDSATVATESTLKKEKGTTGIIFYYGESPISWSTQKQATIALSSCESEFIAATAAATQALWLKRLLSKLTHSQEEKVTIQVDNKSAIALMKNPVFHGRSKHIDTKYHFIRECVEREDIRVEFVLEPYSHQRIRYAHYSLVFGEGLVNDATLVVLFNAVQKINTDTINGLTAPSHLSKFLVAGLVTAYVLKGLYFGRHSSVREISLMVLVAYLSYMLAELFELSGILTVFFSGVLMSHYSWHNVTESSRITTRHVDFDSLYHINQLQKCFNKYAFATLSFIAETFIFLYVGMDALDYEKWKVSALSFGTRMEIYSCYVLDSARACRFCIPPFYSF
ncbi:ribonuclease H-like domain, reverse transcriptase, RNA-dependent DNA polymerase [Tanacetum coccineum]